MISLSTRVASSIFGRQQAFWMYSQAATNWTMPPRWWSSTTSECLTFLIIFYAVWFFDTSLYQPDPAYARAASTPAWTAFASAVYFDKEEGLRVLSRTGSANIYGPLCVHDCLSDCLLLHCGSALSRDGVPFVTDFYYNDNTVCWGMTFILRY